MYSFVYAVLALLICQVVAFPVPAPKLALVARSAEPLNTIPIYVKRQIPAEVPTKSPSGVIQPYKREATPELAPRSLNGRIVHYKRQIPAEVATKSPNGVIQPYKRSDVEFDKRQIPAEVATKSPNGQIVRY